MLVGFPRSLRLRVVIGLLLVLTHVALQPGKAWSLLLCAEQDGRTIVEVAASGSCDDPSAIGEANVAEFAAPCCDGCTDRLLADPTPTLSNQRGEAPKTILPTGPPSQDQAIAVVANYSFNETLRSFGHYLAFDVNFEDPFLGSLRSIRLLI